MESCSSLGFYKNKSALKLASLTLTIDITVIDSARNNQMKRFSVVWMS